MNVESDVSSSSTADTSAYSQSQPGNMFYGLPSAGARITLPSQPAQYDDLLAKLSRKMTDEKITIGRLLIENPDLSLKITQAGILPELEQVEEVLIKHVIKPEFTDLTIESVGFRMLKEKKTIMQLTDADNKVAVFAQKDNNYGKLREYDILVEVYTPDVDEFSKLKVEIGKVVPQMTFKEVLEHSLNEKSSSHQTCVQWLKTLKMTEFPSSHERLKILKLLRYFQKKYPDWNCLT